MYSSIIIKIILFLFFLNLLTKVIQAQEPPIDSLWKVWNFEGNKAVDRIAALDRLVFEVYLFEKPDSAYILADWMYTLASKNGLKNKMAGALQTKGGSFYFRSVYDSALYYFNQSLSLFEEAGDNNGLSSTLGNMANIYTEQGEYEKGIAYYMKSLKISEKTGNIRGQGIQLMNIGLIYSTQGDKEKSLEYFNKALLLHEKIDYKNGIADCLINIGNYYSQKKDYKKALSNFERCMGYYNELNDGQGKAQVLNNIGAIYLEEKKYNEALELFNKALDIQREMADENYIAVSLINVGNVYSAQSNYQKAIFNYKIALEIAARIGSTERISESAEKLYLSYKATGNSVLSLQNYEKYISMRDSILKEKNQRELFRQEYKYTYEKQAFTDSLGFAAEKAIQMKEIQKQKMMRNGFMGGFGLVTLFAVVFFIQRNRIKKEKKRSEELLHNILPEEVANELKSTGTTQARQFDKATILFTDFKGFTSLSESLSPSELVAEIDNCFKAFDGIVGKYKIEKIKTIGDSYMAAGGLPDPKNGSSKDVLEAALEMQVFMSDYNFVRETKQKPKIEMRVGIHTGPVVAGVVGVKKFSYDIWGDSVNIASRMESNGEVGKVNISQDTFELLKDCPQFTFKNRGKISVKGKGEMNMYFAEIKI